MEKLIGSEVEKNYYKMQWTQVHQSFLTQF